MREGKLHLDCAGGPALAPSHTRTSAKGAVHILHIEIGFTYFAYFAYYFGYFAYSCQNTSI